MENARISLQGAGMVVISAFNEADIADAYRIFKTGRLDPWAYSTFEQSALNDFSLVAKENNTIIGYMLLSSVLDESTIEDITVDTQHRNKGIGRKLLDAGFTLAREMQQQSIFLEVRCSNTPAINLYRSMGFELIGERKNYYDTAIASDSTLQAPQKNASAAPRENAYVMKKVL
jgi:ribosomal-protein-alanine N-acetyltransferase